MGQLLSYSITSAVFMIPFYLVFRLLMSGERQPAFNRIALHVVYIVALIAPVLCRIDWGSLSVTQLPESQAEVVAGVPFGGYVAAIDEAVSPVWRWIVILYAAGVLVVTVMTGVSMFALARLVRSSVEVYHSNDFTVYVLPDAYGTAPFSFMNCIVLKKSDYDSDDVSQLIILHESCHVRHRHWIDLLLAQAVCILQWFNPAAWLLRDELRSVHEYQADADVLCALHGNISLYQNLLIKKAVGASFPSLANSLNHSNLKKRI
ncbi:MAG: M56 family metallopeptidase, partial [Duncaniella sp.]|nr:M56 family metallopeptidase [Duncaniella sp.]